MRSQRLMIQGLGCLCQGLRFRVWGVKGLGLFEVYEGPVKCDRVLKEGVVQGSGLGLLVRFMP